MSTNNPKVAGYIPQHLYDFFINFCNERKVSVSKGIALVFASYFGVDYSVSHSVDDDKLGELSLRVQNLEERYSSLPSDSSNELLDKIDVLTTQLDYLTQRVKSLEQSNLHGNLPSKLPSISPVTEVDAVNLLQDDSLGGLDSELLVDSSPQEEENPVQLTLLGDSLSSSKSESLDLLCLPLQGQKLSSLRFGLSPNAVSGVKMKYKDNPEKFTEWTQSKDPDKIGWIHNEKLKGYVPVGELTSEQEVNYLKWRAENILDA